jgi:hypothetical protein
MQNFQQKGEFGKDIIIDNSDEEYQKLKKNLQSI